LPVGNETSRHSTDGPGGTYLCSIATHHEIFYLWRPFLRDPKDDMVLEVAVAAGCESIVSYNVQDFKGSEKFGVKIESAKEILVRMGVLK
jgi:hypothetical protein